MCGLPRTPLLILFTFKSFCHIANTLTQFPCGQLAYAIRHKNNTYTCLSCPICPAGFEVTPICGSIVRGFNKTQDFSFCRACRRGYMRESANVKGGCSPCSECASHQTSVKPCTSKTDAICGDCQPSYVVSSDATECVPCCPCVGDNQDVIDPKCPIFKPCRSDGITKKCRNSTKVVANVLPNGNANGVNSDGHFHHKVANHWSNKLFVISLGLTSIIVLAALYSLIYILRKRRKEAYKKCSNFQVRYFNESRSSLAPFASTSSYSTIDAPSVVNCPIKLCREKFEDELLRDVTLDWTSIMEFSQEEAKRLYRSLLDSEPPKKDQSWQDIVDKLEISCPDFKVSTFVYYIQEIDRNDVLKALHVALHQDGETDPLAPHTTVY